VADFAPSLSTSDSGAFRALTPTAGLPALKLPVTPEPTVPAGRVATSPEVPEDEDEPAPTLLVVDQFEDAFVLLDDREREDFIEALLAATHTGRVVVSLRSDF